MHKTQFWFGVAALLYCFPCLGQTTTTMTFDELPFQSVDGLSFRGIDFEFAINNVSSSEAHMNSYGPGSLEHITDPSLAGDSTGILTLNFASPTPRLAFGVAINSGDGLDPGYTVELFGPDLESLGISEHATSPVADALAFSESLYDYSGAPIAKAMIDFADEPGSFALDNLVYVVPEPGTGLLLLLGIIGLKSRGRD